MIVAYRDSRWIPIGFPWDTLGGILDSNKWHVGFPIGLQGSIGVKVVRRDSDGIPTGYQLGACGNITGCLWVFQKLVS